MGEVTPRVRKSPFIGGFSESHSVMSNSLWPHELYSPWNTPGQNTGEGSLSLLQGIFPTQGSNPGLPHCSQILYQLSHQGSLGGFSGRNRSLAQPLPGFILWTICPLECPSSLLLGPPLCLPLLSWALKKMMGMFTAEISIRKLLGHQRSTFQFSLYQKQFLLPSDYLCSLSSQLVLGSWVDIIYWSHEVPTMSSINWSGAVELVASSPLFSPVKSQGGFFKLRIRQKQVVCPDSSFFNLISWLLFYRRSQPLVLIGLSQGLSFFFYCLLGWYIFRAVTADKEQEPRYTSSKITSFKILWRQLLRCRQ